MFLLLISFAVSKLQRPIFCIHGLGGVQTNAEVTGPIDRCKSIPESKIVEVWEPTPSIKENDPDCIGYFLETQINSTGNVHYNPNFKYLIPPFGSLDGISAYKELKPFLIKKGYTYQKDIFGVTFNWILYPLGTPELFIQLKEKIEEAHKESGMKVIIIAHSLGTHVLRRFITHEMTPGWVQTHVDGVIFNAPAFYGCFGPFDYIISGTFSTLSPSPYLAEVSQKMPSLHAMFDNYVIFNDTVVFKDVPGYPDITAPNVKDFLVQKNMFCPDAQKIFAQIEDSLKEAPIHPPVRSMILYNSAIQTIEGYKGENFEKIYGMGDGVCHSAAPKYLCNLWKDVECTDWNQTDSTKWGHTPMLHREEALNKIYEFMTLNNNNNDNNSKSDKEVKTLTYVLIAMSVVAAILLVVLIILLVFSKKN